MRSETIQLQLLAEQYVENGARLLDTILPNWAEKVDLGIFIEVTNFHIIEQCFGDIGEGLDEICSSMAIIKHSDLVTHGFLTYMEVPTPKNNADKLPPVNYFHLTRAWKKVAIRRLYHIS